MNYEQNNGEFTEEIFVKERYPLVNAKEGGIIRSKTKYLMNETDIDMLLTSEYLETTIPSS